MIKALLIVVGVLLFIYWAIGFVITRMLSTHFGGVAWHQYFTMPFILPAYFMIDAVLELFGK